MRDPSLFEYVSDQLVGLCGVVDIDSAQVVPVLADVLGPAGSQCLSERPTWPSNVADDHTPVEFSLAFNQGERPTLRILGEALGAPPGRVSNGIAALRFLDVQRRRYGCSMSRFNRVAELFVADRPGGVFGLWHAMVFGHGRQPEFKVYFNPDICGVDHAPHLVTAALDRLGLATSWQILREFIDGSGASGWTDRPAFFALDLLEGYRSRVKLYLRHDNALASDVIPAAGAVDGIRPAECAEFCELVGGGSGPFNGHPLVDSYTFFEGVDRPVGYSVYMPIRGYVRDDREARDRVAVALVRYGFDTADLDRAIEAVRRRGLDEGAGLIAHVSLRLGHPRPGVTVYLSSEAYRSSQPYQRHARPPRLQHRSQYAAA